MKYFKKNNWKYTERIIKICLLLLLLLFIESCPKNNDEENEVNIITVNIDNITDTVYVPLKVVLNVSDNKSDSINKDLLFGYIGNISYSDSILYVLDSKKNKIVKLSKNGDFIKKIGSRGSGPGEFIEPRYMTVRYNNIFVSDQMNGRIEVLDLDGKYLSQLNNIHSGNFFNEFDITKQKDIVTMSWISEKFIVTMYDSTGKLKNRFGKIEKVPNSSYVNMALNQFMPIYDEKDNILWIVYFHLPMIKKYDLNGNLLEIIKYEGKIIDDNNKKMAESEKDNKDHMFQVSTLPLVRTASFLPNNSWLVIFNKLGLNIEIDLSKKDNKPRIIKWIGLPPALQSKIWLCYNYNNELVCSFFNNIGITENLSKVLIK